MTTFRALFCLQAWSIYILLESTVWTIPRNVLNFCRKNVLHFFFCAAHEKRHIYFLEIKYWFWRVLPLRDQSLQQSMWTFFHGMDAKRQQTNIVKWCIPHKLNNHEICGGICCWSQTWHLFHNCQTGMIFQQTFWFFDKHWTTLLNLGSSIVFNVKVIYHLWVSWDSSVVFSHFA